MFLKTLSGRILVLTIAFVMLAEVFIFVPSIARFREDFLLLHLERAQIASLALLADENIDMALEYELLESARVFNVVLHRDDMRQLILASDVPSNVSKTVDLRDASAFSLMRDAVGRLLEPAPEIIRVIGLPFQEGGELIEITMTTAELRVGMIDYGLRILGLSAVISLFTAALLFLAARILVVRPIKRVVNAMKSYADAPEDARRIIEPGARIVELRDAEEVLSSMQKQLTSSLRQKDRLAQLGGAVAKVSHDLRNILTTAQLFADRLEQSEDPKVNRAAPKLLNSISRAVNLCETTLAFGKAEEPSPTLTRFQLTPLVDEVFEAESLRLQSSDVVMTNAIPAKFEIRGDPEQLYRVVTNLIRNARQAILASRKRGRIDVSAQSDETSWKITIRDTGPGLPTKALENLYKPFQGGVRAGGHGLGLAIAAELIRGHGGSLELTETSEQGSEFVISLPKGLDS